MQLHDTDTSWGVLRTVLCFCVVAGTSSTVAATIGELCVCGGVGWGGGAGLGCEAH